MDAKAREKGYLKYVDSKTPQTKMWPTLFYAFLVGGIICVIGEGLGDIAKLIWPTLAEQSISAITSAGLVFLASFLTGIGVYDKIGAFAGAGSIVPITGFSNSIASPAIEFKNEGFIFGMAAKMFVVAGPVIVNGLASAFVIGIIYFIFGI